jgi:hypothetical protein
LARGDSRPEPGRVGVERPLLYVDDVPGDAPAPHTPVETTVGLVPLAQAAETSGAQNTHSIHRRPVCTAARDRLPLAKWPSLCPAPAYVTCTSQRRCCRPYLCLCVHRNLNGHAAGPIRNFAVSLYTGWSALTRELGGAGGVRRRGGGGLLPRRALIRSSRSRMYAVGSKRPAGDAEAAAAGRRALGGREDAGLCPRLLPLPPTSTAGVCACETRERERDATRYTAMGNVRESKLVWETETAP